MTSRQQQLLTLGGVTAVVIIILVAIVAINADASSPQPDSESPYNGLTRRVTSDGAPVLGSVDALVTIVEFLDYSCPHCANYRSTIDALVADPISSGQAKLELRILAGLDPVGSPIAARAALCAGEQNAFWEMHNELFRLQTTYGRAAFSSTHIREVAEALQLNSDDLMTCVNNENRYREALQSNVDLANSLNVRGTPAILLRQNGGRPAWIEVEGEALSGGVPLPLVQQAISELAQQDN